MPDPKNEQVPEKKPADPPSAQSSDEGLKFNRPLFGGTLSGGARELESGTYLGNADYLFRNGDLLGGRLKLGTDPALSFEQYGLNGKFGIGSSLLKFDGEATPPSGTYKFGSNLQFANGNLMNADWTRTPNGQNYGADGTFKLGKDGSGTASLRVDEPTDTTKFDTKLKFNNDFSLNGDWNRTTAGQTYGADGTFKLGKDGSGTASFRADEPSDTTRFDTKLKFNNDFSLNGDWNRTAAGQNYGADGTFKLGKEGSGTAAFHVDEPNGTSLFNTKLKFDESSLLNADFTNTRNGNIYGADGTFKLGKDGSGTAGFRVDEPANTANFDTKLKFNNDFSLNGDWNRTAAGQNYGADGTFKLGKDGSGTAAFRVDEPNGTSLFNTKLKFDESSLLNADFTNTKSGNIYGADGTFKLGKDGNGTASFRVDEPANTANFDTKLKFNSDFSLNGDWNRTAAGQVYGADGTFKLGKEGSGTAAFRVDEPNGTSLFNTKLKFNENSLLNADFTNTKTGNIYGADGTFKLGKEGSGTAAFRVDEPNGTSLFNTKLKFNENWLLNADFTNTKTGNIYGADGTFGFGNGGKGTAGFRVDEPANTSSINTKLQFANGNLLNFDLGKSPNGSVYGADGTFGIGQNGKGLASFRIDEPNQTSNYKLGATFNNGSAFNAQVMSDRLGTSLGLDGKFAFDKGAGSVMLDGKFGPRTDLGASINYKNSNLEYSANVRANNEFGPFKVSEFGAKVSTTGNERYKFTAEAGYRPENHEYYGKVGITIQLGGGGHSRPSRPITHAEPGFDPGRSIGDAASSFKEKQSTLLKPENKGLYDQAVSGVEKLNASGAKLPVGETAASLTVLAKQNGMQNIQYVALGNPTSGGQQNLFIGDGDPGNPAAKKAFMDKSQASTTSLQDSIQRMDAPPSQSTAPTLEQGQMTAQKRSAM